MWPLTWEYALQVEDLTAFEKHKFKAEYDLEGYLYESSETKKHRRTLISDHRQEMTDTQSTAYTASVLTAGEKNFIFYLILNYYCILNLICFINITDTLSQQTLLLCLHVLTLYYVKINK